MKRITWIFPLLILTLTIVLQCNDASKKEDNIDWAKGIVWYQLFPERFYNGDAANDPAASDIPEIQPGDPWQISSWTADWYEMQPHEMQRTRDFYKINGVFARRYGGDLQGVIDKLDYLQVLGVDAIYFNPLFEAESMHKYDGATYHHIDDNFGPDPSGDKKRLSEADETEDPASWIWTEADKLFLKMLDEAHQRGIRVVLDGVFNHTGTACFAFQDLIQNQKDSRYADWYLIDSWDDPATDENEFDYKGWWGYKSLPEFKEDSLGLVAGPRQYVFDATRRWMDPDGDGDPADGIDGWRLDVANEVAAPFWVEWYALVKSLNPAAITVSELWDDASDWIHGEQKRMDNTMNYMLSRAIIDFFVDIQTGYTGPEFTARLQEIHGLYGTETELVLWNLIGSHDTDRLASMVVNPERDFDRDNNPRFNADYLIRKPNAAERQIQKQIVMFQMTYIGAPMIYYGDEAGVWGADDPDDRKPMVWPEMQFDNELCHPLKGHTRPDDAVAFDQSLFDFYKKAIALRHEHEVLRLGSAALLPSVSDKDIIAFTRDTETEQAVVVFNRGMTDTDITIPADVLNGDVYLGCQGNEINADEDGVKLTVAAKGWELLFLK